LESLKNSAASLFGGGNATTRGQEEDNAAFTEIWDKATEKMNEGLAWLDTGKDKDERDWYRLWQEPKFRKITQETFSLLSVSNATEKFALVEQYNQEIQKLQKDIEINRQKEISAPTAAKGFMDSTLNTLGLKQTKADLRERIRVDKEQIETYRQEIERVKQAMYNDIRRENPHITEEQIRSLFITADGSDLVNIIGMVENIKKIYLSISQILAQEPDNIAVIRSHAGYFMIMNETYSYALELMQSNIKEKYLPQIKNIADNADIYLANSRELLRSANAEESRIIEENIKSNQLTIDVAERYRQYLQRQAAYIDQQKAAAKRMVDISTITYNTIKNSVDLEALIKTANANIESMFLFKIPDYDVLHSEALQKEFYSLTTKITQ
jgi:hypothetical protein